MNFASLSPSLLARKGGAKPAMRRQSPIITGAVAGAQPARPHYTDNDLEDLGWNDLGDEADRPDQTDAETPVSKPVANTNDADGPSEQAFAALTSHARSTANAPAKQRTPEPEPEPEPAPEPAPESESAENVTPIRTPAPRLPRPQLVPAAPAAAAPSARAAESDKGNGKGSGDTKAKRTAFTLRLDGERHLKLRMACTLAGRSAQALVTDALDAMLAETPELDQLVARVQSRQTPEG